MYRDLICKSGDLLPTGRRLEPYDQRAVRNCTLRRAGAVGYWIKNGGTILRDRKTRELFVSQKIECNDGSCVVKRVFDWKGRTTPEQQYDNTYSQDSYGSGSSSYFGNGISKHHGPSIDLNPRDNPAESLTNDAFDLWVNIFKKFQDESKWTDFKAGVEVEMPELEDEWIISEPQYSTHTGQSGSTYIVGKNKEIFIPVDTIYPRYRGDTVTRYRICYNKRTYEHKHKIDEIYTPARYKK